eukprot:CAMPEP_0170478636 /NCGR_PEP_ID=MMETSP0208-20121228/119_1 /TAXON_ID=197538 /ORGANISM="Strombidium inclinatum, Strain S3" /LENGTH=89 /DNA_ID=CAMNT_0010750929 /DNA_START=411 /DNA_END=681 /DNA_ORIENTATION=+
MLIALPSPGSSDGELGLSTSGEAEDELAVAAGDNSLGVREDSVDVLALRAFDIHEEGVGALDESLQLVLGNFDGLVGVKKINFHCCPFK